METVELPKIANELSKFQLFSSNFPKNFPKESHKFFQTHVCEL